MPAQIAFGGFALGLAICAAAGQVRLSTIADAQMQRALVPNQGHYWSRRGADVSMNSSVFWTAPRQFSRAPSWNWSNPLDEQVRHSPLIDSDLGIYVATSTRIRKFDSLSGALLWTWLSPSEQDGNSEMVACPELYGDVVLAVLSGETSVIVYSLSMATGAVRWRREHAAKQNRDASAMLAHDSTLVFAIQDQKSMKKDDSNRKVMALNASDGSHLWDFAIDGVVWNFSPATPGDGTLLFATSCGIAYRLDVGGRLLWKTPGDDPDVMCSAGGGALGSGGVFYMSWSHTTDRKQPDNFFAAVNVHDGTVLWNKTIVYGDGAAQYPAVGKLGQDGPEVVVVAVGDQPLLPGMDQSEREQKNAVVALDASTGVELWRSEEAVWPHTVAAGDELPNVAPRLKHQRETPFCFPDSQGIPVISGDGTVYASSSHSGDLRAIRVDDTHGAFEVVEVSTFHAGRCFLNSPSLAPGLLVAAPCWGPMYVFLGTD